MFFEHMVAALRRSKQLNKFTCLFTTPSLSLDSCRSLSYRWQIWTAHMYVIDEKFVDLSITQYTDIKKIKICWFQNIFHSVILNKQNILDYKVWLQTVIYLCKNNRCFSFKYKITFGKPSASYEITKELCKKINSFATCCGSCFYMS